jgi:glyoxylase I family protein
MRPAAQSVVPVRLLRLRGHTIVGDHPSTKSEMKISAILHATVLVSDLARARAFYEGVLGLTVDAARPDLGFPGVWYALDDRQQIHLMRLDDPEGRVDRPEYGGRDRHVALAVDDVDALCGRLAAAGVGYTRSRSGRPALFCRDPDGNALEFISV